MRLLVSKLFLDMYRYRLCGCTVYTKLIFLPRIMNNFKKSLTESEDKERVNMVYLYFDIENYLNFGNSKSESKKKDSHAQMLYK